MGYYDPVELKSHHKVAVWLRLQGYSHEEIGTLLNRHPKHISKLVNSKKARELMEEYELLYDRAFRENLAESLSSGNIRLKVACALNPELPFELMQLDPEARRKKLRKIARELTLDVSWTKKHSRRKRRSAEDVVREMMEEGRGDLELEV